MVPNKSFELRRCSNYRKSNYRESTVIFKKKMKIYFKTANESFVAINFLPEDKMVQVTHEIQDKGGIKPCNVTLYMVNFLYNCGKSYCWKICQKK